MDHRRVAGQAGILALTASLLFVVWGCSNGAAPESQEIGAPETPKVGPEAGEDQQLLSDFDFLERFARSGRVIIRISSDEDVPSKCNRKIKAMTYGPTVFWESTSSPSEVRWVVAQSASGPWMEDDQILLEQKEYSPDCFSLSTFLITSPNGASSGPITNNECRTEFPIAWYYLGTLFNRACVTTDNPDGKVAGWDPVVIIKPRR